MMDDSVWHPEHLLERPNKYGESYGRFRLELPLQLLHSTFVHPNPFSDALLEPLLNFHVDTSSLLPIIIKTIPPTCLP
jgi:hypothetical protein